MEPHRDQEYTQHQRVRSLRCFHQIKLRRLHVRRAMGVGRRLQLEIDRAIKPVFTNDMLTVCNSWAGSSSPYEDLWALSVME